VRKFKTFLVFSWLIIDVQKFLNDLKDEFSVSNKVIADLLQTSEKRIGLWENGLKQPSPRDSLKIAALYYNNCKGNEKVNAFLDVSYRGKSFDWLVMIGVIILCVISLILYPQFIISEMLGDLYIKHTSEFHISLLFSSLLPLAFLINASYIFSKYINLSKPNIINMLHKYRWFLCSYLVYLLIVWFLFVPDDLTILFLLFICGIAYLLLHFINFKTVSLFFSTIIKIIIFGSSSLLLIFVLMKHSLDYAETMESSILWNDSRLALSFPIMGFVILCLHEIIYNDMYIFFKKIESFFPTIEKDHLVFQKKDIVFTLVIIIVAVVFFIVTETNKELIVKYLN